MNDELHVALDDADFLAVFPLQGGRTARLIGTVRDASAESDRERSPWDDVSARVARAHAASTSSSVNWFSTYRVHHRVAEPLPRRAARSCSATPPTSTARSAARG